MAPVGIHRAYFDKEYFSALSPRDAESQYRELDTYVRSYLYEMDVPENVIARMMATRSTDATFLQPDEFDKQIGTLSPAYEEWRIAKCGELSDTDRNHAQVIGQLRYYQVVTAEFENGGKLSDEDKAWIEENRDYVQLGMDFGEKHRNDVLARVKKFDNCIDKAVTKHRQDFHNQLVSTY